LLVFTEKHFRR